MVKRTDESVGVALIKRVAEKDRKSFEEFYYLYAEGLARFLMKMLKQREWVDEAVNDTMLTVWQMADRYDPERGRLSTWLFGIAHNKGLQLLERVHRRREESLDAWSGEVESEDEAVSTSHDVASPVASGPERIVMGWELGDAISWGLSQLSADHRLVLELCFSEDRSYQEIADIMNCPLNTVKTRMFHARKHLAELMARKGYTLPGQKVTI